MIDWMMRLQRASRPVAGIVGLTAALVAGGAHCLMAEDQPAAAAAAPVVFQNPIPAGELSFLSGYAGQPAKNLLKDKRYKKLVKEVTPGTTYHYGRDMSLLEAMEVVLDGSKEPVAIGEGRYAIVSGSSGPYLKGRGLFWFDLQTGEALGAFFFQPSNGEPTPTLTVFSRQLTATDLTMGQLPAAFAQTLNSWGLMARIPVITARYFIPANGKKYVLVHDEQYCTATPAAVAPPANICEQLADQAADADVSAAYFMKESHNAANATAWRLGPDQVAWMDMRDRSCGLVMDCRARLARVRTRVLIRGR